MLIGADVENNKLSLHCNVHLRVHANRSSQPPKREKTHRVENMCGGCPVTELVESHQELIGHFGSQCKQAVSVKVVAQWTH